MPFKLLQFCPSVLPFVFAMSLYPLVTFSADSFVSLSCMGSSSHCLSFDKFPDTASFIVVIARCQPALPCIRSLLLLF